VVAFGLWADWYFFCLLSVLLLWKAAAGEPRSRKLEILIPMALFLSLHLGVVLWHSSWQEFVNKFYLRSGIDSHAAGMAIGGLSWMQITSDAIGRFGLYFYFASWLSLPLLVFLVFRQKHLSKRARLVTKFSFLIIGATHLHFSLVHQHYFEHNYESLKLSLLIAALPFAIIPAFFLASFPARALRLTILAMVSVGLFVYTKDFRLMYEERIAQSTSLDALAQKRCEALLPEIGANDILYSPDFATTAFLNGYSDLERKALSDWTRYPCHHEIFLTKTPKELAVTAFFQNWNDMKPSPKMRVLFQGEPSREWRKVIDQSSRTKVGDLILVDLATSPREWRW
jgi:hypothetical protein